MRCQKCRRDTAAGTKLCEYHRSLQAKRSASWHVRNRARNNARSAGLRWEQKRLAIEHYGGRCACCGEAELIFLTLDHVNDDGANHRRESGTVGGWSFYYWLRRRGYPEGLQVLCSNCNLAKQIAGRCPHQGPMLLATEQDPGLTLWEDAS